MGAISVPALPLSQALEVLSAQAGVSIGMAATLPQIRTRPVHDAPDVAVALAAMLRGSDYVARAVGPTAWRIQRAPVRKAPVAPAPAIDQGDIVVTGTKRILPMAALSRAVAVFDPATCGQDGAIAGASQVADAVEGLVLTALGPGRNRLFLRGVADSPFNGSSQTTVAMLLDDSRLTYSAPDPDLKLVDVERVEVLKGPQGALYGTGALGGIYRIVTRRADTAQPAGEATLGLGAAVDGGVGPNGSTVLNLPLVRDSVGLRLVGYAGREPGWIDTGTRPDSNASTVTGGRADLGIDSPGGWRIDLSGLQQRIAAADSQYTYAPGARTRPAQLAEPHSNTLRQGAVRGSGSIGAVDLVVVSSYSEQDTQDTLDATVGAGDFGLANPQLFLDQRHFTVWDSEVRFTGGLGRIRWLAGIDTVVATEHGLRGLTAPGQSLTLDDSHRTMRDSGLFADATLPLGHRLELELGGRLYRSSLVAARIEDGQNASEANGTTGLAPSAALAWHPHAGRLVWLRYGSAFRQGGLDLDAAGRIGAVAGDRLTTLEAGWREQLAGGGQFDTDVFFTRWNDVQSDRLRPDGLIETVTAGQARIVGAEFTLTQPLSGPWLIRLGGTVQSAQLVRNQLGFVLDDRRLPVIPDYTLRGGLRWRFRLAGAAASAEGALRYLGPARLSFDPRLDRPMGQVLETTLQAALDWGKTRLDLRISNVLNRSSDSFAYGNPFRIALPQFTPQPPLRANLSLTRAF